MKRIGIFMISLSCMLGANATVHKQLLDKGWVFREARKVDKHPATVPGTVHTDLLDNGIIPDPFIGENERQVQWVDKEDWIYETVFSPDQVTAARDNINLVFDGLDTYADVYLNDSLLLSADNMFRQWEIPVKALLKDTDNRLTVYFHSPIKTDIPKYDSLPFQYDAVNDQSQNGGIFDKRVSVFARKAGYHYGWDWGPRLVTSGIWRPVYLLAWSGPVINNPYVTTKSITAKNASMNIGLDIDSDTARKNLVVRIKNLNDNKVLKTAKVDVQKGLTPVSIDFNINNPKLWWTNGLGEPFIYNLELELLAEGKVLDRNIVKTGVRTIEVVRDEDANGRSFYFKLNGTPVFAKGANYIPNDNFLPRVTAEKYKKTLQDAADANMNMLRVWGGGIYENDIFYNLCDSLGILVWQDFMFACALYPSEGQMLDNIEQEARQNVRRLRNHPCIALWCGNNECLEAWYAWGLKRRYEDQGFANVIWKQYDDLFHHLLPEIIEEEAPATFYWSSSPFSRVEGQSENNRGDTHLWSVWSGDQPIDTYNDIRSRFFSEYGFQSFPELKTVKIYAPDSTQHFLESDVMLAHQRAGSGANKRMERYLLNSYHSPKDFNSFLYLSQLLQGDAVKTAIEAHRRDRPYCMGTLFWQHNDCWPVASWSSRDYYGNWKAQHYFARKAYRDIMMSAVCHNDSLELNIVSDRLVPADGSLSVSTYSLDGKGLTKNTMSVSIKNEGVTKLQLPLAALLQGQAAGDVLAYFELNTGADTYDYVKLFATPKSINLGQPAYTCRIEGDNGEYTLKIKSDNFVRGFNISFPFDYTLSDNYFDLIPGKEYTVSLKTEYPLDTVKGNIRYTDMYTATH